MKLAVKRKSLMGAAKRIDAAAEQAAKIRRARGWSFNSTAALRAMRDGYRAGREPKA